MHEGSSAGGVSSMQAVVAPVSRGCPIPSDTSTCLQVKAARCWLTLELTHLQYQFRICYQKMQILEHHVAGV